MIFVWKDWDHYDWAHNAKKEFYDSLSTPEVKSLYESVKSKAVVVCVFGKSQVGKTTLILKLSGISDNHFPKVSETLRGGSPPGAPCSPTAIIYKRSESDLYTYVESGIRIDELDDEAMCRKLKRLRSNVERGSYTMLDTVEVHIPKKYFAEVNDEFAVTIVDLPGYGSAIEAEHSHTEKLFKKYLPLSSIRLLVENANNVVSLEQVNRNGVVIDWQYQPEIYRIILTRSATAKSVSESIHNDTGFSKDSFCGFYEDIVKNKIKNVPKGVAVYPIEYGQSWEKAKKDDPQLFSKCNPIFDEMIENLKSDILNASDPDRQITTLFNSYKVISKIKDGLIDKFEDKLKRFEENKERLEKEIKQAKSLKDKDERNLSIIVKKRIMKLNFEYKRRRIPSKRSVSALKLYLEDFRKDLIDTLNAYFCKLSDKAGNKMKSNYERVHKNIVKKRIGKSLEDINSVLESYFLDRYWKSKNWNADTESCRESCDNSLYEVKIILREIIDTHNTEIEKDIQKCKNKISELESTFESLNRELQDVSSKIRDNWNEQEQKMQHYKRDEEIASKFKERLLEKYKKEFEHKWLRLYSSEVQPESIIELIQLVIMNYAFFKLMKI